MKKTFLTLFLAITGGLFYYGYTAGRKNVEVAEKRLRLPRLDPPFDRYRLVQISDIHMDRWMSYERLSHLVDLVNRQQPDLVAMTGDFVSYQVKHNAHELTRALSQLVTRDGAVAILGNHDHMSGPDRIHEVIKDSGMIDLTNRVYTLRRGNAALHLCGVDDIWARKARLDLVLRDLPEQGAAILLAHEPDFADIAAATGRFDLQLSGHSHAAQVIVPLIGPPFAPLHSHRYRVGLYDVGTMKLYVNRGLGTVTLPIRVNCPPEITVFTLESA
jgi:predicted MPP superfamily phosphohydrolase